MRSLPLLYLCQRSVLLWSSLVSSYMFILWQFILILLMSAVVNCGRNLLIYKVVSRVLGCFLGTLMWLWELMRSVVVGLLLMRPVWILRYALIHVSLGSVFIFFFTLGGFWPNPPSLVYIFFSFLRKFFLSLSIYDGGSLGCQPSWEAVGFPWCLSKLLV